MARTKQTSRKSTHDMRVVNVGTPPSGFEDWTMTAVRFHNFVDLPTTRDVHSPEFFSLGNQWRLEISPGGDGESDDGMVAVYLVNRDHTSITVTWCFAVRDSTGKEVACSNVPDNFIDVFDEPPKYLNFDAVDGRKPNAWGNYDFSERQTLIDALLDGTLTIEVRMRRKYIEPTHKQFIPKNPIGKNILKLYNEEETADVVFEVGDGDRVSLEAKGGCKRVKTSTTTFYAHRLVIKDGSTTLAELCKNSDEETTTIPITNVNPNIFKHVLYYLYGGKVSDADLSGNAKEIVNACDKYGVVNLKLEAEAHYVKSTAINIDNMMENLLYADSMNLALLKESVMDYIVANKHNIIGKVSFEGFPSHLVSDLLTAVARIDQNDKVGDSESIKYNKLRVGTLRQMLDDKGLNIDGSREAMIAALKEDEDEEDED